MTIVRDGVRQALGMVVVLFVGSALLDLGTCWMALAFLPWTSLVGWAVLGWAAKACVTSLAAWGLMTRRWLGPLAALPLLGLTIVSQQHDWIVLTGRSPYRATLAWLSIWVIVLAMGTLRWGRRARETATEGA